MDAIASIKKKLLQYPHMKFVESSSAIRVFPSNEGGFELVFSVDRGEFTVHFDGWHEWFDDANEALNCFAMGLSNGARLKVLSRGGVDYNWTLESRQGESWVPYSTVGLLVFPFWRKRVTAYTRCKKGAA